jgi:sec-independent protein translocase protein TatB
MFEVNFSEMMVIAVVALIVIGPERLPKVARTLGHLWGRAQRYVNGVKSDISRDMAMEEFRQMQQKVQAEASAMQQAAQQISQEVEGQVQQLNQAVAQPVEAVMQKIKSPPSAEIPPPVQQKFPID